MGLAPWGLCCPLLHHRHLPLIGCARTFIGIGVFPSSLEPGAGLYRCIRPFSLKLQRLSKTYAMSGECQRTHSLTSSGWCRFAAVQPVVAPMVTDFVNLSRPAARLSTTRLRTDVLWVQPAAASSRCSLTAALNNPLPCVARCASRRRIAAVRTAIPPLSLSILGAQDVKRCTKARPGPRQGAAESPRPSA